MPSNFCWQLGALLSRRLAPLLARLLHVDGNTYACPMSWGFLLFGLAFVALGAWMTFNPDQAAKAVQSGQHRGGVGSWAQDEPQMPHRNELGVWVEPGGRARAMRWVGVVAVAIGLGLAIAAIVGLAN